MRCDSPMEYQSFESHSIGVCLWVLDNPDANLATCLGLSQSAKFFRGRVNASAAITSCKKEVLSYILEFPKRQNFFKSAILKGSLLSIFLAKESEESVFLAQWSENLLFFLHYSQPSTWSYFSWIVECTEGILREMDASTKWKIWLGRGWGLKKYSCSLCSQTPTPTPTHACFAIASLTFFFQCVWK